MKLSRFFWAIGVSAALALLTACGGGSSSPGSNVISGTVTQSGVPVADVMLTLTGGVTAPTTTTDAGGNYSFTGVANGNYSVTPSKPGLAFSPTSSVVTMSGPNITGTDFNATGNPNGYSQADLVGTWRFNVLDTGGAVDNSWQRGAGTVDATGWVTVSSYLDSSGDSNPPATGSFQWTMNSSGVVSETGANGGDMVHMTMTSNKNFIAGTGGQGGSQLRIIQKVVPGTVYSSADVFNKTFVYHSLRVGGQTEWRHGVGTTDNAGALNISSETRPSGTTTPGAQGTISVDNNGVVTLSSEPSFSGYLSDDKKTVVGTLTDNGRYILVIFQLTGQTYSAGAVPVGTSDMHMLVVGAAPAPMWNHATSTTASGGVMSFSHWASNNSGSTAPTTPYTGSVDVSGRVSLLENASFHGQVSHDGKFVVGTQTLGSGVYSLQVTTK